MNHGTEQTTEMMDLPFVQNFFQDLQKTKNTTKKNHEKEKKKG